MTAPALRSASFLAASSGSAAKSGSSDSSTGVAGVRTVNFTPAAFRSSRRRGLLEARITSKAGAWGAASSATAWRNSASATAFATSC